MKSKNLVLKLTLSFCAFLVLIALFLPLWKMEFFVTFSYSIKDFFLNQSLEDLVSFLGGEDSLSTMRTLFAGMLLLQAAATAVLWLLKGKGKAVATLVAGIYESGLAIYLISSLSDGYGTVGAGAILLLIAGLVQLVASIVYLIKGETENINHAVSEALLSSKDDKREKDNELGGKLVAIEGQFSGAAFPVGTELLLIGRNGDTCNIILDDSNVSRKHCGIKYDAIRKVYHVFDYSSNGTFLSGGGRLMSGENEVQPGSVIQIGNNSFLLQ